MKFRSLNKFLWLRTALVLLKYFYYTKIWGMDIHSTATYSLSVKLDRTYPKGVHIGAHSYLAFDVALLTHDRTRGLYRDTRIGQNCFIGARSVILPGVQIGDNCVIGAGSIVTKDVPSRCIAAGNPATILRRDIEVGAYGRFSYADTPEELREHRQSTAAASEPVPPVQ